MTDSTTPVTGGVDTHKDTHKDTHVAAVLNPIGVILGTAEFPASPAGYRRLLAWMRSHGDLAAVGVEGTGANPDRLDRERSFAALRGTSPIDASSGRQQRHRLNRGGDRNANAALFIIVISRLRSVRIGETQSGRLMRRYREFVGDGAGRVRQRGRPSSWALSVGAARGALATQWGCSAWVGAVREHRLAAETRSVP